MATTGAGSIHKRMTAAGYPVVKVVVNNGVATVTYAPGTSAEVIAAGNAFAQTLVNPRRPRKLRAIVADLNALSGANKQAIWAEMSAGNPQKWTNSDEGAVWSALLTAERVADPLKTELRLLAVAVYVRQENPDWLIAPVFAPGANVPGDEVIP